MATLEKIASPFGSRKYALDPIRIIAGTMQQMRAVNIPVIDLTQGNPLGPTLDKYASTIEKLVIQENLGQSNSNGYAPSAGLPEFRKKVTEIEKNANDINISTDHVIITPGATTAISILLGVLADEKKGNVVLLKPFFPAYTQYCEDKGLGIKFAEFSLNKTEMLNNIENAIDSNTRALIINSPNNPSGQIYSAEFLNNLGQILGKTNHVLVISDEPYRELLSPGQKMVPVLKNLNYPLTAIVYSFSKSLKLAGLRIGYIALHPDFPESKNAIALLERKLQTSGMLQASTREQAALAQFNFPLNINWQDRMQLISDYEEQFIRTGYKLLHSKGTFYICLESPDKNGEKLFNKFLQENMGTIPTIHFGLPNCVRLSFSGKDALRKDEILSIAEKVYKSF